MVHRPSLVSSLKLEAFKARPRPLGLVGMGGVENCPVWPLGDFCFHENGEPGKGQRIMPSLSAWADRDLFGTVRLDDGQWKGS